MKHFLVSLCLLAAIGAGVGFFGLPASAEQTMPTQVIGYTWVPNLGWLDFGSDTPRVTVDQGTGVLSGTAWNPSVGWFRFGPDLAGPAGRLDRGPAKAIPSTTQPGKYNIIGWFRACSVYLSPGLCAGTTKPVNGTELGGWDGWMKMHSVVYDPATMRYDGHFWGDLVVGWGNMSALGGGGGGSCNPAVQTCGGGGGGSSGVTCEARLASNNNLITAPVPVGTQIKWIAKVQPSGTGYTYAWTGDITGTASTVVSTISSAIPSTKTARVTVNRNGSPVGGSPCTVTVQVQNSYSCDNISSRVVLVAGGSKQVTWTAAAANPSYTYSWTGDWTGAVPGTGTTYAATFPGSEVGQKTATVSVRLNGSTVATCSNTASLDISGTGQVQIIDGDGAGNQVKIINPKNYERGVYSTSNRGAKIKVNGSTSDLVTANWSGLETLMSKAKFPANCQVPKFCVGDSCVDINSGNTLPISDTPSLLRLYFQSKCSGQNGISVFHNPAGFWQIKMQGALSGSEALLLLRFNDEDPTPL